jgi:hypothetical protein
MPSFVNIGHLLSKLKWGAPTDSTVIAFVRERKNAMDRKMCTVHSTLEFGAENTQSDIIRHQQLHQYLLQPCLSYVRDVYSDLLNNKSRKKHKQMKFHNSQKHWYFTE